MSREYTPVFASSSESLTSTEDIEDLPQPLFDLTTRQGEGNHLSVYKYRSNVWRHCREKSSDYATTKRAKCKYCVKTYVCSNSSTSKVQHYISLCLL